jgi:hypothetical protein
MPKGTKRLNGEVTSWFLFRTFALCHWMPLSTLPQPVAFCCKADWRNPPFIIRLFQFFLRLLEMLKCSIHVRLLVGICIGCSVHLIGRRWKVRLPTPSPGVALENWSRENQRSICGKVRGDFWVECFHVLASLM